MRAVALAALAVATVLSGASARQGNQPQSDPHRPRCNTAECRKISSFVKAHYCGASPFGNGPDDGCDTRVPKKLSSGIKAVADFGCNWDEAKGKSLCEQHGEPPSEIRDILLREMRTLGLPPDADKDLHFIVWETSSEAWTLAAAYYERVTGGDLILCQLIAVVHRDSHIQLLRQVRYQKTDADVPNVTTWSPIDIADVDGDGRMEIVLQGDAYENHWYEVDRLRNGSYETIFSGLGYYL
jgi:hypothetical protein